ncbi:MAG: glycosyltransferase family 4 protein [Gemmatimonadaceae bacterium]|nr:glycosyltransferase family 4 protein [Gemmatimonadaceae bacterium]
MRIALFTEWFLPRLGGIELQVRDLALQLKARGHDVEVITPVGGPAKVEGLTVRRLGAPRLPGAGIVFTAGAFRRIRDALAEGDYDVAHVHFGIISPAAYGATRAAQQLGIPTVATFHSVLTHFGVPLSLVRRALGAGTWKVHWSAVSSVVAASMRPLVGDSPVTVVPNGVDLSYWGQSRQFSDPSGWGQSRQPPDQGRNGRPRSEQRLRAVAVMRLHRRKRPALLLDAVASAHGRVLLEIIGDGPQMPSMRRAVTRRGLGDVVTLHGWMPRERVRETLRGADVFLLPSRLEAFGIAALEARAAGVPVIAMAAAGVRDFLTDGADALLATDDAHFTRLLESVAGDPSRLARLSHRCQSPPAGADWSEVAGRMEAIYHRLAGDARLSPVPPAPT